MTSIVLVHGAWGGSYGFRRVRPLLAAAGHDVFTPSLTGIGERSHLAGPDITLGTHMHDVYNTIFYEDLHDIVLVGFSYGGMVVTGLLDRIGDRVRDLVYLDALLPTDGQAALDIIPGVGSLELVDGWGVPPLPRELATPEATAWSNARRHNQPIGTLTEAVSLSKPLQDWPFTRTYIKATADPNEADDSAFWQSARACQASDAWDYHEIACNHMVPFERPQELADIIAGIAT